MMTTSSEPPTEPSPSEQLALADRLRREGDPGPATVICERLIATLGEHPPTLFVQAMIHRDQGRWWEAADLLSRAVALNPDCAPYHLALGSLLHRLRRPQAAMARFRDGMRLDPHEAEGGFLAGTLAMDGGHMAEAVACFEEALRRNPDHLASRLNLGLALRSLGRLPEARAQFEEMIARHPEEVRGRVNLALLHLTMADYPAGWQAYEWRWQLPEMSALLGLLPPALPRWQGESAGTLLILGEQGFGDTLQFVRYLPILRSRVGRLWLAVPTALHTLLARLPGLDRVVRWEELAGVGQEVHWYLPLLTLPGWLATRGWTSAQPHGGPRSEAEAYLEPDPQLVASLAAGLKSVSGQRRLGLTWQGKPLHQDDPCRQRSCPATCLAPLATVPGITWISLQTGIEKPLPDAFPSTTLQELVPEGLDFHHTAAVIKSLDGVVSVDTAVAHLAGAMGKPVWLLLPFTPDWRWENSEPCNPWYPAFKLYRQSTPGEWQDPITRLRHDLL